MYQEYMTVFNYRMSNLEEVLRTPVKNKNPLLEMIAKEARIYAFQKCAESIHALFLFIHKECEEGKGPEDFREILLDIEKYHEEYKEKHKDYEDEWSKAQKVRFVFELLRSIPKAESDTLMCFDFAPSILSTPLEFVEEEDKEEYLADYAQYFNKISRFYSAACRLKEGFLVYGDRR